MKTREELGYKEQDGCWNCIHSKYDPVFREGYYCTLMSSENDEEDDVVAPAGICEEYV